MLEKYENIDFINSSLDDINNIISEICNLSDIEIKNIIEKIIENYKLDDELNEKYDLFFSNEKINRIFDEIYNECNIND
jgi:hypothetical protein